MRLGLFAYFGGEIVRFHLPYGDGAYLLVGEFRMFHAGLLLHQQCEPLACLVKIVDDGCGAIADDRLERLAPNAQRTSTTSQSVAISNAMGSALFAALTASILRPVAEPWKYKVR